jgi:hypothetical protein
MVHDYTDASKPCACGAGPFQAHVDFKPTAKATRSRLSTREEYEDDIYCDGIGGWEL